MFDVCGDSPEKGFRTGTSNPDRVGGLVQIPSLVACVRSVANATRSSTKLTVQRVQGGYGDKCVMHTGLRG